MSDMGERRVTGVARHTSRRVVIRSTVLTLLAAVAMVLVYVSLDIAEARAGSGEPVSEVVERQVIPPKPSKPSPPKTTTTTTTTSTSSSAPPPWWAPPPLVPNTTVTTTSTATTSAPSSPPLLPHSPSTGYCSGTWCYQWSGSEASEWIVSPSGSELSNQSPSTD